MYHYVVLVDKRWKDEYIFCPSYSNIIKAQEKRAKLNNIFKTNQVSRWKFYVRSFKKQIPPCRASWSMDVIFADGKDFHATLNSINMSTSIIHHAIPKPLDIKLAAMMEAYYKFKFYAKTLSVSKV